MKNILIGVIALALLLSGSVWWSKSLSANDPNVVATNGIHWHPELEMYVKGEKIEIPENIGLGSVHMPIHTHDDLPVIHLEFIGRVTRGDIKLGNFFRNWGRDMREFGEDMRMTVNGEVSIEYENYELQDGDNIVLEYD